ncbi:ATP-binding protein [Candidatus Shapirobacteria bacterium]|nr:MAG: ATP-binding protein [Candidatus Shapirobacteria bacterium]
MNPKYSLSFSQELLDSTLKEQRKLFLKHDLGIQRNILNQISKIIKSPQIVIITGLRRVGKSTLLAQLAHKYLKNNFYYVNFEDDRLLDFQLKDFNLLHQSLIKLFGQKKTFLFDEIQNIPQWERFVRRLHDRGYKFIITGSNASLLSQELGTRLTGRSIKINLYPFSFKEFLSFKKQPIPNIKKLNKKQRKKLLKLVNQYLILGGIPDALKYPKLNIHKNLYDDVLYRDITTRYKIDNQKSLKELTFYLVSNSSSQISYNKLKNLLKLGSVNTVKNYIDYLENSWLFFILNKYAYSIKEQQIANKKIYSIDTGLVNSVGFSFSKNKGKMMENVVFLQLKQNNNDIYFYKSQQNHEVDFFLHKDKSFIQVSQNIDNTETRNREIRSLIESAQEQSSTKLQIISEQHKEIVKQKKMKIFITPLYEWLLQQ